MIYLKSILLVKPRAQLDVLTSKYEVIRFEGIHSVRFHVFQTLMSATMEVTCAATLRSARTRSAAMDASVPEVTDRRESAFPVWVRHLPHRYVMLWKKW